MRNEREKAERRQRNLISVAIVAVIVALIAVGGWAVKNAADDKADLPVSAAPRNLTDGGVDFPVAEGVNASKAPLVQVYEDFQCPACKQFHDATGAFLQEHAFAGDIRLRFMPFAFLHDASKNEYPRRSMNLAMCAVDAQGTEAFWKVNEVLFKNQPAERTAGPTNPQLLEFAKTADVEGLDDCVNSEKFVPWIDSAMEKSAKDPGFDSTPARFVNGEETQAWSPADWASIIAALKQ